MAGGTAANPARSWFAQRATLKALALPMELKFCILTLHDYANNDAECWPGQARLATDMGCSEDSVKRYLRALKGRGLIGKRPRFDESGRQTTSTIQFMWTVIDRGMGGGDGSPGGGATVPGGGVQSAPPEGGTSAPGEEGSGAPYPSRNKGRNCPEGTVQKKRGAGSGEPAAGDAREGGTPHTRAFSEVWSKTHGGQVYPFDGAKDGAIVARIAKHIPEVEAFKAMVSLYCRSEDRYLASKGHNVQALASCWQRYAAESSGARSPRTAGTKPARLATGGYSDDRQ